MNDIELITTDDIKEVTSISKNVDPTLLEPFISIAEKRYVYEILGTALTSELKNQITGHTVSTPNQKLLLHYIRPLAAYASWYEAAPFIHFKTVQKGIVKQTSDNADNVTPEEFASYRASLKEKVKWYQDELKCFLDDNANAYPQYRSGNANRAGYNNGIYLGRSL